MRPREGRNLAPANSRGDGRGIKQPPAPLNQMTATTDKPAAQGWTVSNLTDAAYLGILEIEATDPDGHTTIYAFDILQSDDDSTTPARLAFGSPTNSGFLESGFLPMEDGETLNAALHDLHDDLQTYYLHGPRFTSRIVFNERM